MLSNVNKHLYGFTLASLMALSLTWTLSAGQALAQDNSSSGAATSALDRDAKRRELANFNRFLDDHPKFAQELGQNPSLINDAAWVAQHPELATFLKNHPAVAEDLKENPVAFMKRERRFERMGGDITPREVATFDEFLDKHPEIAEQLNKDPRLIDDKQFVENHPALANFLKNHPEIREDLKENPRAFMKKERRFDRREDREGRRAAMRHRGR